MSGAKYSREEVATRGEAIYEQDIRRNIESESKGKYLVLDIETGEYEMKRGNMKSIKMIWSRRSEPWRNAPMPFSTGYVSGIQRRIDWADFQRLGTDDSRNSNQ